MIFLRFSLLGLAVIRASSCATLQRLVPNEQAEVEMDYHELNVQALKVLLTDRGLPVKGKKAELIERLRKHDDGSEREMDSNTEEEEEENASSSEEGD